MGELKGACIIGQSGGPTSVINASALGVIETALKSGVITQVLGAENGIKGVLNDRLFDMGGEDEVQQSVPIPKLPELGKRELMAMEKETTGLYLSGHPMDEYREQVRRAGAAHIGAILGAFSNGEGGKAFRDGQSVCVAGVVQSYRTRTTKNNTLMSYVNLEDDTGTIELIVFQRVLDSYGSYIHDNAALIVTGRISVRDEKEPQIMTESLRPISDAPEREKPEVKKAEPGQKLWVRLKSENDPALGRIALILQMFPGTQQLVIYCENEKKRLGAKCLIHEALIDELREMLGDENVVVR